MNLKSIWSRTVFTRIVALFFLFFLPIILMAIFMYQDALSAIEQNTLDAVEARAVEHLNKLEEDIERIKMLQMDLLLDEDLWKLSVQTSKEFDYAGILAIRRIQQRLSSAMLVSNYVEDFRAHLFTRQRSISATRGLEDLSKLYDDRIIVPAGVFGAQLIHQGDRFSFTSRRENQRQLLFDIEVVLDVNSLNYSLDQMVGDDGSTAILIFGDQHSLLSYSGDKELIDNLVLPGPELDTLLSENQANNIVKLGGNKFLMTHHSSKYLNMTLIQLIPYNLLQAPIAHYYRLLWIYIFVFSIVTVAFIVLMSKIFRVPLQQLVDAFRKVEKGDLSTSVDIPGDTELAYLGRRFNKMVGSIRTLVDENLKQQLMLKNAELKQLQAQINPHFLYNSFYILSRLIKLEDLDKAQYMARELGKYFRYVTYNAQEDVPLKDEWSHAATYADIMSIRFGERISIQVGELPSSTETLKVPRLILQPLVENAFEHGVRDMDEGGLVLLKACRENDMVIIEVYDNGAGLNEEKASQIISVSERKPYEVTGLANIHKRLKLRFGDASGVKIISSPENGTRVQIHIPININGSERSNLV